MKTAETVHSAEKAKKRDKYKQYRRGGQPHAKPKNFRQTASRLLSMLKGSELKVAFVVILGAAGAFLSVLGQNISAILWILSTNRLS